MKVSPEIQAAADWVNAQADEVKSCSAVEVSEAERSFAAQRIRACAAGMLAGLFIPDPVEVSAA